MVNITKSIGNTLRMQRQKKKMTQDQVAYEAGMDFSYYNQIENGKRNPSIEMLQRISKVLGIKINDLF